MTTYFYFHSPLPKLQLHHTRHTAPTTPLYPETDTFHLDAKIFPGILSRPFQLSGFIRTFTSPYAHIKHKPPRLQSRTICHIHVNVTPVITHRHIHNPPFRPADPSFSHARRMQRCKPPRRPRHCQSRNPHGAKARLRPRPATVNRPLSHIRRPPTRPSCPAPIPSQAQKLD